MQLHARTHKPALLALVALWSAAWLSLLALQQSPYGRLLSHTAAHGSSQSGEPAQPGSLLALAFFAASWALMVVAMMLPTILPRVMQLSHSIGWPGSRSRSLLLLLGGYVSLWTVFGIGAHVALQPFLLAAGLAPGASRMAGPLALIVAGTYQLTPIKRRSVQRACTPPGPVLLRGETRWQWSRVFLVGAREGAVCLGCCWALMLLMLVGVAGSSGGMLALGAVMWSEQHAGWGHRLVIPLGLLLIGLGLTLGWGQLLMALPQHEHSMYGNARTQSLEVALCICRTVLV